MNKTNAFMKLCVYCLMAIIFVLSINTVVYAQEEAKDYTFNSVVEITSYELEGGYLEAGKDAKISLVLHNANKYSTVNSVLISLSSESAMIYPSYGHDNQIFVGTLSPDETITTSIPISVASNLSGDYVGVSCFIVYETNGVKTSNTTSMILPTQNNVTVTVNSIDVSPHATVNGKSLLSVSYENKGNVKIDDAAITVEGNVSEATKNIELGTIAAEKSYTKDFNIIYNEAGDQSISLKLSYTDIDGKHVESDLGTFRVNVGEENEHQVAVNSGNVTIKWIGRIIALAAIIIAILVSVKFVKSR